MPYSELASPRATRAVLEAHGLSAKYALGQNFLIDDNIIGGILNTCGLARKEGEPQERSVLEIGPGIGTLTVALLQHACVVAVERDRDLAPVLAETCALNSDRFALIEGDALKVQRTQIDAALASISAPLPHMLVANLPYAVAATVVLDWLERFEFLDSMTVMVQSEVADRFAAEIGTKNYAAYSIKLRMYAKVTSRFQVSPNCFYPAPRVQSAVVRLDRAPLASDPALIKRASEIADAAFAQRRKTIRNSMRSRFTAEETDAILAAAGIDPRVRAETLPPEAFLQMAGAQGA